MPCLVIVYLISINTQIVNRNIKKSMDMNTIAIMRVISSMEDRSSPMNRMKKLINDKSNPNGNLTLT